MSENPTLTKPWCPVVDSLQTEQLFRLTDRAAIVTGGTRADVLGVVARMGDQPEEMVGPALFLASDASSFVTGQVLVGDGGLTAASPAS